MVATTRLWRDNAYTSHILKCEKCICAHVTLKKMKLYHLSSLFIIIVDSKINPYLKDASNGDSKAQLEIGKIYHKSLLFDEAMKWFNMCASQDNSEAMYYLGDITTIIINWDAGCVWFERGAALDNIKCICRLGIKYFDIYDTDLKKALQLFTRGVELNDPESMCWLGLMYTLGRGVYQSYSYAYNLFIRGVKLDNDTPKKL
jgi:TPR repeat protein